MTDRLLTDRLRPLVALLGYAVRLAVPGRRLLVLLPLTGGALFGLLARGSDRPAAEAFALVGGTALHTLVVPLTCLVIGDAVLGSEIRSGTFALTWLSPVRRSSVVVARWLGGWLVAAALVAPAALLSAVVAGAGGSAGPAVVSSVAAAAAYLAVFLLLGAAFRRSVFWSLALVALVEPVLGAVSVRVAQVSPSWLGRAAQVGLSDLAEALPRVSRDGMPLGGAALVRLAVVVVVCLALAGWRLRALRLDASED